MKRILIAGATVLTILIAMGAGLSMSRNVKAAPADAPAAASPTDDPPPLAPGRRVLPAPPSPMLPFPSPAAPSTTTAERAVADQQYWQGPGGSMNITGSQAVALTFDDGPNPNWTPRVLTLLRSHQVKATFCVVGTEVEANPELLKQIAAEGHTLCNHSWHHELDLGTRSADEIRDNLKRTNEAIRKLVPGAEIAYYRQPGGNWTERVIEVAMDLDMAPLHWTVDPSDWDRASSAGYIENQVIAHTGPGSIVLMHDGGGDRRRTYTALTPILSDLQNRFELIPLP